MSARRTLMQWTVTRFTLVAWISMEHLKFTIRHGFVIFGTRIEGRHFILTFHDITFRMHRPRLCDIESQEKSGRCYPQYGGRVGLNQTLQSDARRSQSSCNSERGRGISKDLSLETSRDVWSSFDMTS